MPKAQYLTANPGEPKLLRGFAAPMARALLGEREALPATEQDAPPCFSPEWLGAKPHYADPAVCSCEGWMVWTYLPGGDPAWVADCPTYAEAEALALSLSAPTLWEAPHA